MTDLERTIMTEISTLPETRLPDVLAFIRYLKLSIPKEQKEIEERFDEALKSIRARAKEMNIIDEDITAEIRAVRFPLRGKPIVYREPFKGVADNNWESK
jgi:hypothetical protein